LLSRLSSGRIANSMLQTGLNAIAVIAVFPLQLGLVRCCAMVYTRGAAAARELLYYYRHYFANTLFMALAVVAFAVVIQQLTLIIANLAANYMSEQSTFAFSIAFQLTVMFYLMLRLCASPWLFVENPQRSTIQIFEYSFKLTKNKNRQTLRFFWWAPAALVAILILVGLFMGNGQNVAAANAVIIAGSVYFIPRTLLWLSGYVLNLMVIDKVSRPKGQEAANK
jgi:hypothetical protein